MDTWKPNPCGCRSCNVCAWYYPHLKPQPKPPVVESDKPVSPEPTKTLFDEVPV